MNTRIILAFFLCLLVTSCGKPGAGKPGAINNDKRIDDLIEHFKKSGLDVGERSKRIAPMIGASDGAGLKISGTLIEVYKFDIDVPVQKNLIEKYSRDGVELMGYKDFVIRNGSFILFVKKDHPKWQDIQEAFLAF